VISKTIDMRPPKTIAMVAHDYKKPQLIEWAKHWHQPLKTLTIYATGTTGKLLEQTLGLTVKCLQSGPLGGDQQIGALITEGKIDYLIFFWDPLTSQPHDSDVKALLRLAVLYNIPTACNISSADFVLSSVFSESPMPTSKCFDDDLSRAPVNHFIIKHREIEDVAMEHQ
jgi:methylglyoxal synthase